MLNKNTRFISLADYIESQDDNIRIDTFRLKNVENNLITDILPQYLETMQVELSETEINKYTSAPKTLSYDLYKSVDLWFILCIANGCKRSYEFRPEKVIKLPTTKSLNAMIYAFNNLRNI